MRTFGLKGGLGRKGLRLGPSQRVGDIQAILLDSLDSLTGWVGAQGQPIVLTSQGIKLEGNGVTGQNPSITKEIGSYDPSTLGLFAIPITFDETPNASHIEFQLGLLGRWYSSGVNSNKLSLTQGSSDPLPPGQYWLMMSITRFQRYEEESNPGTYISATSGPPAGVTPLKIRIIASHSSDGISSNPPDNARVTIGKVYAQVKVPKVPIILGFDDSENTIATEAQPRLASLESTYNISAKATAYLVPLSVVHRGTTYTYSTGGNKMTVPQWQAWKAAGHAIAVGSPADQSDTNLTVNPTATDAAAGHTAVVNYINSNGLNTGDNEHVNYSGTSPSVNHNGSAYNGAPLASDAFTTTQGQVAFTLGTDLGTSLVVGNRVRGLGVPSGTTIATLAADRLSGTLSSPALLTGTRKAIFEDIAQPFFNGKLRDALVAAGFKTGRGTTVGPNNFSEFGVSQPFILAAQGWSRTSALSTVDNWINTGLRNGTPLMTYVHRIEEPSSTAINMLTSTFQYMLDGLASKVVNGQAEFLTISQWYNKYKDKRTPF